MLGETLCAPFSGCTETDFHENNTISDGMIRDNIEVIRDLALLRASRTLSQRRLFILHDMTRHETKQHEYTTTKVIEK